jgi:hypothetical protein
LQVTSLAHILNDRSLWKSCNAFDSQLAVALRGRWFSQCRQRTVPKSAGALLPTASFAKGFVSAYFCDHVDGFRAWLRCDDQTQIDESLVRRLAIALVVHGFREPSHLTGLIPADIEDICDHPALAALLRRGVEKQEHALSGGGPSRVTALDKLTTSASAFSDTLNEDVVKFVEKRIQDQLEPMGIPADTLKPRVFIEKLAETKQLGSDVQGILADQAHLIEIESSRKSLGSVASGLRAWHAFSVQLKGYCEDTSLPPRCADDVVEFVALFKSNKTVRN